MAAGVDVGAPSLGARAGVMAAIDRRGRVRAAGGLVMRDGRVLLVHRPRYDDWSFPKGKARSRWESDRATALEEGTFVASDEVDEVRWLSPRDARALLTYDHDRSVLDALGSPAGE